MPPRNRGLSSCPARAPCRRLAAAASTLPLLLTLLALLTSFAVSTPGISAHTHAQTEVAARSCSPALLSTHLASLYTHAQTEVAVSTCRVSVHTRTDRSCCQHIQYLCTYTRTHPCCLSWQIDFTAGTLMLVRLNLRRNLLALFTSSNNILLGDPPAMDAAAN